MLHLRLMASVIAALILTPLATAGRTPFESATSPTTESTSETRQFAGSTHSVQSAAAGTLRIGMIVAALAAAVAALRVIAARRLGSGQRPLRELRVLEHLRLTPKVSVHLVQLGDRKVLIGSSDACVAYLTDAESTATELAKRPASAESSCNISPVAA